MLSESLLTKIAAKARAYNVTGNDEVFVVRLLPNASDYEIIAPHVPVSVFLAPELCGAPGVIECLRERCDDECRTHEPWVLVIHSGTATIVPMMPTAGRAR